MPRRELLRRWTLKLSIELLRLQDVNDLVPCRLMKSGPCSPCPAPRAEI
jgi:hypothetical protein